MPHEKQTEVFLTESTVMRMMQDERDKLTDQQIFTSSAYNSIIYTLGKVVTGRTKIPVQVSLVWQPDKDEVAYATADAIVINAAHPSTTDLPSRLDKHLSMIGKAGHEFGHCLFTDFQLIEQAYETFEAGDLYPNEPVPTSVNEAGIRGMKQILNLGAEERKAIADLYDCLDNYVEDSYLEKSMAVLFPGDIKKGFDIVNEALFGDGFLASLENCKNEDGSLFKSAAFMNALLILCKMGYVDFGPDPRGDIADILHRIARLAPRIRREITNANAMARKELVLAILLENWDLFEEDIQKDAMKSRIAAKIAELIGKTLDPGGIPRKSQMDGNSGHPINVFQSMPPQSQQDSQQPAQGQQNSQGDQGGQQSGPGQQDGQGSPQPGPGQQDGQGSPQPGSGQQDGQGSPQPGPGQQGGQGSPQPGPGQQGSQGSQQAGPGQQGSQGSSQPGSGQQGGQGGQQPGPGQQGSQGGQLHTQSQQQDVAMHQGIELWQDSGMKTGGAGVNTNMYGAAGNTGETTTIVELGPDTIRPIEGSNEFSDAFLKMEEEMAMEVVDRQVDDKIVEEMKRNAREAKATDSSATRGRVSIQIRRVPTGSGVAWYERCWPKIRPISKRMQKDYRSALNQFRSGSRITGLPMGRRVHSRSLHRQDEQIFQKKRRPNEPPKAACAILIDCSTSMDGSAKDTSGQRLFNTKLQAAKLQSLILYDFSTSMGLPTMVVGHSTGGGVIIESAAAFQRIDQRDRYRIAGLYSISGNRDGTALNYVLTELMKRTEEVKFLFIISDGLPNNYGSTESGVKHIQEVLDRAKKEGVHIFASALKEDMKKIQFIYGENMFEVTDLNQMPRAVITVMKRLMKIR